MAAAAAGVGRLEEEALRRKERLKALREKTGRKDKDDGEPKTKQLRDGEEEGEKHRELRLRNYVPEDEDLKKRRVPQAKPVAVEEKVKEQLEAAKPEPVIEEVGPFTCVSFLPTPAPPRTWPTSRPASLIGTSRETWPRSWRSWRNGPREPSPS
ncbi:coiled-coil domain-containing protein 12 isoform X2 [Sorex araneus]|uniref:coiled-coil domain-containing protein 12 isoform X2 n=1 Tax=Sorex araneus TaxID=42254 RepID=UPI0024339717|nr:coiled-coil domain-containing protein 12 isoform X2 [Sorex araneus]